MTLPWNPNLQQWIPNNQLQVNTSIVGPQLIKVKDLDSAKAYPTSPNSSVALFEENDDVMYIKTTDTNNFPTIRKFRFVEEPLEVPNPTQYVTIDEFNKFKEEILNAKQFVQQPANTNSKWNTDQFEQSITANKQSYENGEK